MSDILMLELREAVKALRQAWTDAGPHPEYHRRVMDDLRHDWPVLVSAIEGLLKADPWTAHD